MTRLLLIRHARPDDDARGRCYGKLDVDLGPDGRREAEELAQRLRPIDLAVVHSSPRLRALQTAAPIAALHGLEPMVDDRLAELDFGDLEGRTYDEIARAEPELYRAWMETPTTVQFPNGESYALLRRRALEFVEAARARTPDGTAAVVTHGGVVRAIVAACLEMPDSAIFRLRQDYCALSVVDWVEDVPLVQLVNGDAAGATLRGGAPAPSMRA